MVFARDARTARPVASTTKLMTALLVLERVSLDDVFTAPAYRPISPAETRLGLRPGERMTVRDLLTALLLASANDAAETLAVGTAGSTPAFVALMNRRARELGLRQTSYANPIGLDAPDNHSSAADLIALTRRLRANPFFARTVDRPRARLTSGRRARVIENRNSLIDSQPHITGVKTGHTLGAGYVLVGSATRGGVTMLSAVLGDPSEPARNLDTLALLDYGLRRYRAVPVLRVRRPVASAAVRHREEQRVRLRPLRDYTRVLRHGRGASVRVDAPPVLEGPLPGGARVGSVRVVVEGRPVARVALVTAAPVPEVGVFERARDGAFAPGTLALMALILFGVALALSGQRRRTRSPSRRTPAA